MADDQVKYSDLIADDVVKGFELLNQVMKDLQSTMASLKTEATNVGSVIKGMGSANRDQQQEIARLAAEVERLKKQMKGLSDEEKKVTEIKRQYKKLTDDQIARVDKLASALGGLRTADEAQRKHALARINLINVENMSYNEMQATYNALKDALNNLNTAQRQNTDIGKAMTARSAKLMETMNQLQISTGKYTLQVGKYRAAFDGLGYSFQQILREAPSALNLNQFFLAISNNVPMFLDQLKAFKNEQAEIKANLATMTEGTKEYAEQLGKVESVGKKLGKVLVSWQSLVLVGLMLLRNWEKIVNGIRGLFMNLTDEEKRLKNVSDAAASSIGEMTAKYESLRTEWQNLKAEDQGEWLKKHKNDWLELGYSIDDAKKAEDFYVNNTAAVQEAIDKRAKSVAGMKLAAEKYEEAFRKQVEAEQGRNNRQTSFWSQVARGLAGAGMAEGTGVLTPEQQAFQDRSEAQAVESLYQKRMEEVKKLEEEARGYLSFVDDKSISAPGKPNGDRTPRESRVSGSFNNSYNDVTMADLLVQEANAMSDKGDTVLQTIQMWYDKRVAITNAAYEKEKETLAKEKKERLDSLTQNLNNAKVFESKYDALVAEVDKDPDLDEDGKKARKAELKRQLDEATELIASEKKQRENIDKYYKDREKIAEQKQQNELADLDKQRTEKLFKEEERRFKARQDADKRRFDLEKHNSIEQAKFNMEQEIASKQWQIDHAKELELSEEQLAILKEEVEWLNKKYNQGNYNAKRGNTGNYSNIIDVLFGEKITSDQISAINSVFDQAKEALNSWMDARKAAADQAKELADDEVSAAENALNREIELRNQGYANDVALRERELADAKEKQKQAVEEQNKIAKEQILLDAAMQTSSLITASANIIKQFPNPLAWVPMLATMWGAFGYAKIKAYQASTKSITFGEGGSMLLEGGSHQSGHDVNLGIGPDGSNLRAEGGEYFAVINKRNSRKYGSEIPAVVNALNSGMFEDRYIKTSDAVGLLPRIIRADDGSTVDLSAVESGVGQLVKQGESRWTVEGEYRVERYKNRVRRVRIS